MAAAQIQERVALHRAGPLTQPETHLVAVVRAAAHLMAVLVVEPVIPAQHRGAEVVEGAVTFPVLLEVGAEMVKYNSFTAGKRHDLSNTYGEQYHTGVANMIVVPNGSTYQVNIGSGGSIVGWAELR